MLRHLSSFVVITASNAMKKGGSIVGKQKYRAPGYIWISGTQQIFVSVKTVILFMLTLCWRWIQFWRHPWRMNKSKNFFISEDRACWRQRHWDPIFKAVLLPPQGTASWPHLPTLSKTTLFFFHLVISVLINSLIVHTRGQDCLQVQERWGRRGQTW